MEPGKSARHSHLSSHVWIVAVSLVMAAYSAMVLGFVATSAEIGFRCLLGTKVKDVVAGTYEWAEAPATAEDRQAIRDGAIWSAHPPRIDDTVTRIDGVNIHYFTDYVKAINTIQGRIGGRAAVRWIDREDGRLRAGRARIGQRPLASLVWSLVWFAQQVAVFVIGACVFWKRPGDRSARLFFWLCVVTAGAFMGGYHWSEIVISPPLIFPFAAFALFVPVVSLHFYLVFPAPRPFFERRRRWILSFLYGFPSVYLALLWFEMIQARRLRDLGGEAVAGSLRAIQCLSLGYVAIAVVLFLFSLGYLIHSFRRASQRSERNQIRWILLATILSTPCIGFVVIEAIADPSTLGREQTAWPMFTVSLMYTIAYAVSITRYRLMKAEEFFNRGVAYFVVSLVAGLIYSGLLVVATIFINERLIGRQKSLTAVVGTATTVGVLIFWEAARRRFQRAIDRRFSREKTKFDQALGKMRLAVGSLVDRGTLSKRVLEAAADVLRLEWGAIYFGEADRGPFVLCAFLGPRPDEESLATDNPLVDRLRRSSTLRLPRGSALSGDAGDQATDAMIALGGEVAVALEAGGKLAGVIVLGPKQSGAAFEDDEIAFLGALGSVAALALHSAGIQRTLEALNHELRDKVEKISEQQRRILILQDQLLRRGDAPAGDSPAQSALPGGSRTAKRVENESLEAFERIKGSSVGVRGLLEVARKVAASNAAVLIRGESGTGKELLAEAIHASSPRAEGPLVKVHCAALSQTLLESELFGHVKSAFTGADRDRVGRFQQADGGTLFLDEIGDINLETQTKLLRVLQEMTFERVGSSQSIRVDVRIVAATHQDLEAMIRDGRFRADLYYRLNVISLRAPSLRERRDDIFELALHFLRVHAAAAGKEVTRIDDEAIEALTAYDWPGNIRELENVIERAVVLCDGPAIRLEDLSPEIRRPSPRRAARRSFAAAETPWKNADSVERSTVAEPDADDYAAFERRRLLDALREARGNKSEAARLLMMPRSTFCSRLVCHGLIKSAKGEAKPASKGAASTTGPAAARHRPS